MRALPFLALLATPAVAADLPRATPESQGVSSAGVLAFVTAADQQVDSLNSFMLVRHGHVVAEGWWGPYSAEQRHMLFSLSKSFTATAVGLAVAEKKLSLDDEIVKLFPADVPPTPSAQLKAMRVRDLLRMATGHQTVPPREPTAVWTKAFLAHPVPFKPGTHFLYNSSGTYMLSAAVQRATGQPLLDYLQPRLFAPLGMQQPTWETSPQGIAAGGYGLSARTEDVAKLGQLYLQGGKWDGKQLLPVGWVAEATARQTANGSNPASDWDQGYGYQFWRCRHGAYRGDGAYGQFCVVLPEQDAVVAITAGTKNMQGVLNLLWDKLLPAMKPEPLPAAESDHTALQRTLKGLTLKVPAGTGTPAKVAGKTFKFPANDAKLETLSLKDDALVVRVAGKEQRIEFGIRGWKAGRAAWGRMSEQPAAAAGAWTADATFTLKIAFTETPFVATVRLTFSGNEVRCATEWNVGAGNLKDPVLVGTEE